MSAANRLPRIEREARLSDQVADAILETILSQRLKPGDLLPPERELGKQFGVSRTVIREAIRGLDAKGLLEVRTGSGARVASVDSTAAQETLRQFVHALASDDASVAEVRSVLEVAAAGLAAQRATPADFERVQTAIDRFSDSLGDVEVATLAELELRRAIAAAAQNPLLVLLHDAIGAALGDVRMTLVRGQPDWARVLEAHRRILEALAAHDPITAQAAMREHLEHVAVT
jgi:GntR family transcriptional repressor for pyruvate dehydrogenase complex